MMSGRQRDKRFGFPQTAIGFLKVIKKARHSGGANGHMAPNLNVILSQFARYNAYPLSCPGSLHP